MAVKRKIAILTSGGDAPGMNAAIRAVVRTAIHEGLKVQGVMRGFDGLLDGEIEDLYASSVSDVIQKGGTILKTARCPEMMTPQGQDKAANICKVLNIEALVIIGGDGSFRGGERLMERGVNILGVPGTIDLDLDCTDYTIGFDTAVNTGMKAINKIRDTSSSHERCSVVEVMGRNAGYLALWCSMTGGAEEVLIPEIEGIDEDSIIKMIIENRAKGKTHNLIVIAEGRGGSVALAKKIESVTGIESRATILGHLQRGGSPSALDRMHASIMGYEAVKAFIRGERNRIIVHQKGAYQTVDLSEALNYKRQFDKYNYDVMKILSV